MFGLWPQMERKTKRDKVSSVQRVFRQEGVVDKMKVEEGHKVLKARYGNPNAVFASGYLNSGQQVAVIGENGYLLGRVTKTRNKVLIRHVDEKGRCWMINAAKSRVLVKW